MPDPKDDNHPPILETPPKELRDKFWLITQPNEPMVITGRIDDYSPNLDGVPAPIKEALDMLASQIFQSAREKFWKDKTKDRTKDKTQDEFDSPRFVVSCFYVPSRK